MPKDNSIKKVLVIGSGPIVIGQAAEFDYSGTQACQSLKEEGIQVVLVNSNPATIMTDKEVADRIYIEPLTVDFVEKIIEKEKPDSIIAGMGGQTGLNLVSELYEKGILEKNDIRIIGTGIEAIKKGEDREIFKEVMQSINQPVIESLVVTDMNSGRAFAREIGFPVVVRPAYTLGGTGGGIAEDEEQLCVILENGLSLSPAGQVLIEKCIRGWKEIEYEVIRDSKGNCITVCNMENIDPVGIHTGDSIVVAPSQTLSDKEYQMLRSASIDIINEIGIEGGCNVQFALNPGSFEYAVIEINPRVSRSSALASKATGYPIARVAAKIAVGYSLDEIKNAVTGKTYACFEPSLDYIVVKIPRWPFDKFKKGNRTLGTKMMATGEIMSIGSNFEEALLKGIRSLDTGISSLCCEHLKNLNMKELKKRAVAADDERIFCVAEMLRKGYMADKVSEITGIDKFFTHKIKGIVDEEEALKKSSIDDLDREWLLKLKKKGFSDCSIAGFLKTDVCKVSKLKEIWDIKPSYKMVDTCSGEFDAVSPYFYSTYDEYDEVSVTENKKIIVIGSGPIRIGQGIEFDYASVHCILALAKTGYETIIVNNNPETVSTDFNIADRLYFEPLTCEDVMNIINKEKPYGVILQFGGQTAIKLARTLSENNVRIIGTSYGDIDKAENREKFDEFLESLNIKRPRGKAVKTVSEGVQKAKELEYPVLVRPSYVLGGQGMQITHNEQQLKYYLENAFENDRENPVLIDKYLEGREIEVDAICDGEDVLIPGIMEHLERAGIHSGDSITLYPSQNISDSIKAKILEYTKKISVGLKVSGMINIQFIEYMDQLYIIEVNPRASRTVPYISKISSVPIVELATRVMLGEKLEEMPYGTGIYKEPYVEAVKVPVFSSQKLPGVEMCLGPEMKSTGEVLGVGENIMEALYKGFIASGVKLHTKGTILACVSDSDKKEFVKTAKKFDRLGYSFIATPGTCEALKAAGINAQMAEDGSDAHVIDSVKHGRIILVINTPTKGNDSNTQGFKIRRTAVENSIGILTSLDTANALADVLESRISIDRLNVYSI